MAPSHSDVYADCEKMMEDARVWHDSALEIAQAAATAESLALDPDRFSFAGGSVHAAYQQVQQWVAKLLEGATRNLSNMSDTLVMTANDFSTQDRASADHINRAYEKRGN